MSHTVYITSQELDIPTVTGALNGKYAVPIEDWEETKTITFTRKGKEQTKTKTTYTAVLLVEKDAIDALRHYVKVNVHRNFYPREWQEPTTLFVRFTPDEKRRATLLLSAYKKVVKDFSYEYIPKNGFGFYKFNTPEHVPIVAGMLKAYPEFSLSEINYAKKFVEREPRGDGESGASKKMIRKKDGTVVFNPKS
jgi:hypothetical protein